MGWAVGEGIGLGLPGKEGPGRFLEPGSSGGGPGVSGWTGNPNPKLSAPGALPVAPPDAAVRVPGMKEARCCAQSYLEPGCL